MFLSLLSLVVCVSQVFAAPSILLIGDSTVTDGAGWGAGFCADTNGLASCINLSVGGKTCTSWPGLPEYYTMLSECQNPDTWAT